MTRKTISERLAQLDAQKKTLQLRLSKQERRVDTRRKVLIGALVLHRLAESEPSPAQRSLLEWLQRELPKFLVRDGDRHLFGDLLTSQAADPSSGNGGEA